MPVLLIVYDTNHISGSVLVTLDVLRVLAIACASLIYYFRAFQSPPGMLITTMVILTI